jgi:hypothetical protein
MEGEGSLPCSLELLTVSCIDIYNSSSHCHLVTVILLLSTVRFLTVHFPLALPTKQLQPVHTLCSTCCLLGPHQSLLFGHTMTKCIHIVVSNTRSRSSSSISNSSSSSSGWERGQKADTALTELEIWSSLPTHVLPARMRKVIQKYVSLYIYTL